MNYESVERDKNFRKLEMNDYNKNYHFNVDGRFVFEKIEPQNKIFKSDKLFNFFEHFEYFYDLTSTEMN